MAVGRETRNHTSKAGFAHRLCINSIILEQPRFSGSDWEFLNRLWNENVDFIEKALKIVFGAADLKFVLLRSGPLAAFGQIDDLVTHQISDVQLNGVPEAKAADNSVRTGKERTVHA